MLVNELKSKGSTRLNSVLLRNNAHNNNMIIRLYFNDWTLIQSIRGFGRQTHTELKAILNNMKVEELRKWKKLLKM